MSTYRIGDIRPNPFRNIDRYPINREKVDKLKESIGRTEFWDNLVARINDGNPEIAYGHHRMVALRELYPADHAVSLIVRDLDDAAMLHVMADENMQEWASSGAVQVETVRAVRDFLRRATRKASNGGRPPEAASARAIATFLGWGLGKVEEAVGIIRAEEAGELEPEHTAGLDLRQATVMRQQVARIADPVVKARAISRVREELSRPNRERIGTRGIPDVVREVRAEAAPPEPPKLPSRIAEGIYSDIDKFWRVAVIVNDHPLTRAEVIRLIAANRDALDLTLTTLGVPWAEQIAIALDEMADTASALAQVLRAETGAEVVA